MAEHQPLARRLGLGFALGGLCFTLSGPALADEQANQLITLAEPLVSGALHGAEGARFSDVFVVTSPTHVPRAYSPDLPKVAASVCGWIGAAPGAGGHAQQARFWASYATTPKVLDDSQVAVTIEDNNSRDLSIAALARSDRFLRGWRQYCVDAAHPE